MRRAIAPLILLLFLVAGCEIEKDPVYEPLDPSLLLTDGFCLISKGHVVLNHYDIDYYDYGAHLIYLKEALDFEEEFKVPGTASVYADSTRIYDLSLVSAMASYIQQGPLINVPQIMYPNYTVNIEHYWFPEQVAKEGNDPCEDQRIVDALKKYGQFRHGLQCSILSFWYNEGDGVILELELRNEDPDRMSLLESDSSHVLTITYEDFDALPPGDYDAYFKFPGPGYNVAREDLDLEDGRIWLGELQLYAGVVIQ